MRTSFFVPVQTPNYNNKNVSFKGYEAECLKKIAKGKIGSQVLSSLVEGPVNDKITPELQDAFTSAWKTGKVRSSLEAYFWRKTGLTKPK